MWLAQPCSAFDIVVVVLRDHRELVHDFSTELGKVATLSKLNFNNMDLSRRRNGANFTSYSNESLCENQPSSLRLLTHGVCMIVSGGEGVLGADWGLGTWRVWIHTITGRRASVEIQSLVELIFLPTSLVEQWLQ